jgi:hypothetical protein
MGTDPNSPDHCWLLNAMEQKIPIYCFPRVSPGLMHPRQTRETSWPVRPSLVYSIPALLHPALPFRGEGSAARAGMGEAGVIGGSLYSPLEAISRGTEGSNPSPSSKESAANLISGAMPRESAT